MGYMLIRDKLAELQVKYNTISLLWLWVSQCRLFSYIPLCLLQEEKNKVHKERVEERRFTFLSLLLVCFLNIFAEKLPISGQRRGAESENQVKRETEEIAVTVVEILTVGIEIATGIMSMTETIISHAGMTREAGAVRVPGRGKDQEIMIAAGNLRKQYYYLLVASKI